MIGRHGRLIARPDGGWSSLARRDAGLLALGAIWLAVILSGAGAPPWGIYISGAIVGALYGLVAIGLVLIYRASRIVSFAQAGLGAVPAVAGLLLYTNSGYPFAVAVAVMVLGAVVVGAVLERVVVRRFEQASRFVLTVATIGIGQVLLFAELYLPRLITGSAQLPIGYRTPLSGLDGEVGGVVFDGNHLAAVIVAAGAALGLSAFLRRNRAGVAIRAAADDRDRAVTLGLPTGRLATLVWVVAAVLSALGVFLRAPIVGLPAGGLVGPSLLLFGLAAAAIGRMDSMPRAMAAAVGLGIVDQTVFFVTGNGTVSLAIVLPVTLIALLAKPPSPDRRSGAGEDGWRSEAVVRPVPSEVRAAVEFRLGRLIATGLGAAVLVGLPLMFDPARRDLATQLVLLGLLGISLVLLIGWAGQISLGQLAFAGVGAAVAGTMTAEVGADFFVSVLAAGASGAVLAAVIGVPALRMRGPYLAVVTLALAAAVEAFVLDPRYFGWLLPGSASAIERPVLFGLVDLTSDLAYYYFCLAVLVLVAFSCRSMRRGRAGRVLVAARDNPRAAQSFGASVVSSQISAFAISGFVAALAGGLMAHLHGAVDAGTYATARSLELLAMVAIGGFSSLLGPVLGAGYLVTFRHNLPDYSLLATGAGMLVVLLVLPGGFAQLVFGIRDWFVRQLPGGSDRADAAGSPAESVEAVGGATRAHRATSAGPPVLACRGLEVSYDGVQILFGVDLEVGEAEIVALLGTNGAGKSTALRAIAGIAPHRAAELRLGEDDIRDLDAVDRTRRGIALVQGGHGVFPSLTVEDNLRVACWLLEEGEGVPPATAMAHACERFPRLRDRLDQPAANLSGGEQQMLAIAMALVREPRVLIIDELSLGLAPTIVEQILDEVRAINRAGVAVLLVEQSVNVALTVAERAYFLERGEVRFEGPTAQLLERPDLARAVFLSGVDQAPTRTPASPHGHERERGRLTVTGLSKRYGGIAAVREVHLAVDEAEIVGIIGPNGAGKTTLFDLISGFVPVDAGRIALAGVDVTAVSPQGRARLGMGRSFQDARIFGDLTVAENLAVGLDRHLPVRDAIGGALFLPVIRELEVDIAWSVADLLELMGLGGYRDVLARDLSTGTRRLVDLAMAVAHRPSVLLLDEPSSGVAQRETEALVSLLERMRDETGAALVLIDHDIPLVAAVSDRVIAMDLGEVIATGSAQEVLEDPRVVEAYLGSDPATIHRSGALSGADR
jgi:ABC-type branched-subunit amino acid transport system ATPase component/ABC-type branched-subunit amino acid transport system permease subunit